jgi:alpha-glucuronidase
MTRLLVLCAALQCVARAAGGGAAPAYSQMWLSYAPVSSAFITSLGVTSVACPNTSNSSLLQTACAELRRGLGFMLGFNFSGSGGGSAGGASVSVSVEAGGAGAPVWPPSPALEGFSIARDADGSITVSARAAHGALNGVWRLLRLVQGESASLLAPGVVDASAPASPLRMWQLWDNLDGTIARGMGSSVLYPLANASAARVADFARLLSSVGINALSLSNVNGCYQGNEALLLPATLVQLAPIARTLHAYGIHSFLVPCWSSPQIVGKLNSSDPRDARVTAWWRATIDLITDTFGGGVFRGFLFKGDTEGEPGPGLYNWTEQEGANYFGALLNRTGLCIWRAFSHPPGGHNMPLDQALYQFQRFADWDAQTQPNVVLQIKNGAYDFQVREPVHALFGALPRTSLLLELEALPEYVGQNTHVTSLPMQWAEYLSFDLGAPPGPPGPCAATPTTLAGVISGGTFCNLYSGVAGVSNLGSDSNWTRHILNGANTFGLGRLAWAPALSPTDVLAEWVRAALPGSAPPAVDALVALMAESWEAYENFTASLGWGFICGTDHYHTNMKLQSTVDYTNASATRVGYARGAPGAFGSMYNAAVAAAFTSLDACPEELLLSFFNVPYNHTLKGARYGGLSVLGWINASHAAGARTSASFVDRWRALDGQLRLASFAVGGDTEADVFAQVTQRLQAAAADAAMFSLNITNYFDELIAG